MNFKRKALIILLTLLFALTTAALVTACEKEGGLTYSLSNGEQTITGYYGKITDIEIPEEWEGYPVTAIGNAAFFDCNSLKSIKIPDGVTSIGYNSFNRCSRLESVTVGKNLEFIGDKVFQDCTSLKTVYWNAIKCTDRGILSNYPVFNGCSDLTTVIFGNEVQNIPAYMFSNFTPLKSIEVPDSVTSIGYRAFEGCTGLESITFGENSLLTSIDDVAFYNCTGLKSIVLPDSITSIGSYAFLGCVNLTTVYYGGTQEQWKQISIGHENTCLTDATIHFKSSNN